MVSDAELESMIKKAKEGDKDRKFTQAVELIMVFKDIDVKKGFSLNETIQLPKTSSPARVCVLAKGDMGTKAKNAKADRVVNEDELNKMGADKRASRKFINSYDFFLADTQLMPVVGKVLGQILGPRGKMPTPVPFNAPIESFLQRFRSSIRVRLRASLALSCKIGDETMDDKDLAVNAHTVINTIEKKLPSGDKNIKKIMIKTTMGKLVKEVSQVKKKNA